MELVEHLCRHQPSARLYMVPVRFSPEKHRRPHPGTNACDSVSKDDGANRQQDRHPGKAKALVTGDSVGQVASQTLDNIRVVSAVSQLPILRPLIGDDKEEIITVAKRIGTFEVSIGADDDCCSMFVPKHPETNAKLEQVEQAEAPLAIEEIVSAALQGTERHLIDDTVKDSPLPDREDVPSET